jgi:alcohol dehydrogenase, propanol-preferring
MSTYNVFEVSAPGILQASTRELVEPASGHVRIRVEACGVCHTDAVTVSLHPYAAVGRVPGHEIVGTIDAVGPGVERWAVGDRAGVGFLGGHCGVCDQCRRGNFVACTDQPWTGTMVDGGYAEVAYARATSLVAIPDELTSAEAAPLLCAGFTTYNALLKSNARPGDLVAIQGIGGLGHLGLQYAAKMGLRVAAIARGAAKRDLALGLGADYYIDSVATDAGQELAQLGGAAVIIATAAAGDSSALLNGLASGGRLVVVGASDEPLQVSPVQLVFGDVHVEGSLTGRAIENEDNLKFAVHHGVAATIESRPLKEAPEAFERMMKGDARFRVVLTA